MIKLLFVRHGEFQEGGFHKFSTRLTDKGREQARTAGDFLALDRSIRCIYTSTLERARETATIIGQRSGVRVKNLPTLQEIYLGDWEGKGRHEIKREYPELFASFMRDPDNFQLPNGEGFSHFVRRIRESLAEIHKENPDGTVVLIGHQISIAIAICLLENKDLREFTNYVPENFCGISVVSQIAPYEYKLDAFDTYPSDIIATARARIDENKAFWALSFSLAIAVFTVMFTKLGSPSWGNAKLLAYVSSLTAYFRYLYKYWKVWLRIPPLSPTHDGVNWAIMIVGSASAAAILWTPAFFGVWALCYGLVAFKERLAVREMREFFHVQDTVERLRIKSGWAIAKACLIGFLALATFLKGNVPLVSSLSLGLLCLWVFMVFNLYALARDLIR